ncbi:MAG: hypothetical protein ACI9OD_003939 [Limisphaerales bacterium]|jgi:uncharacterized protein (DUF1501 family)
MNTSRRKFLQTTVGSSALLSMSPAAPQFLLQTSAAAETKKTAGGNILVVIQLSGGNDGLNTVVPYANDIYNANRFTLRINPGQVLKINDEVGFHPAMSGFSELLEEGKLSVLQGIGYPNPNRSHFSSMDIWHTGHHNEKDRSTGWLGRYLDRSASDGGDVPALHLGTDQQPLALAGEHVQVPTAASMEDFKLDVGGDSHLRGAIRNHAEIERKEADSLLGFLQQSTLGAFASSQRVQEALSKYQTSTDYPSFPLARRLRTVAQLIDAEMSTPIYYLTLDGFDTHANQSNAHSSLLSQLSQSVAAFIKDLTEHGHDQRVLVMTFSEFGRRLKENASQGTDHGVAAPMFLAGGKLKPGLIGRHPSLTDLDKGDLKHHTDFRQVYAAILDGWLRFDSKTVLGKEFQPAAVFKG